MLRNRKEIEESKLLGVNRVADPLKLKPGTFTQLANWIPAKRYKLKKKRGVAVLVNEVTPLVPALCSGCPEGTLPEAQALPEGCCYDSLTTWGMASDTAGSLNYVDPADDSFWTTSCEGSGFSSGPYPDGAGIKWKLWENAASCALTDISSTGAVPFSANSVDYTGNIQASQSAQAGRNGHSDEKSYMLIMQNVTPAYFDATTSSTVYFGESTGAVPTLLDFNCNIKHAWTKYGTQIFQLVHCPGSDTGILARWPTTFSNNYYDLQATLFTGGVTDPSSPIPDLAAATSLRDMFANANYLYVLVNGAEYANPKVMRLSKAMVYSTGWDILNTDFADAWSMHVFSDDLIFLLNWDGAGNYTIGFLNTGDGSVTTIATVFTGCTGESNFHASNTVGFQYANNNFYICNDAGNVVTLGPLLCPGSAGIGWEFTG